MAGIDENWTLLDVVVEGVRVEVGGMNVWDHDWQSLGERITVADPLYPQSHHLSVYSMGTHPNAVIFAAGEFSANVWGFYVPQSRT